MVETPLGTLSVNEYIVDVCFHMPSGNFRFKRHIDHSLELAWRIAQSKLHDQWYEYTINSTDGCNQLGLLVHRQVVETPHDIYKRV